MHRATLPLSADIRTAGRSFGMKRSGRRDIVSTAHFVKPEGA